MARSKWVLTGVAIAIASIDGSSIKSSKRVVVFAAGNRLCTNSSFLASRSATPLTFIPDISAKFLTRLGPQYPYPITPTLIILTCPFQFGLSQIPRMLSSPRSHLCSGWSPEFARWCGDDSLRGKQDTPSVSLSMARRYLIRPPSDKELHHETRECRRNRRDTPAQNHNRSGSAASRRNATHTGAMQLR